MAFFTLWRYANPISIRRAKFGCFTGQLSYCIDNSVKWQKKKDKEERSVLCLPGLTSLTLSIVYWTPHIPYNRIRRLRSTHTKLYGAVLAWISPFSLKPSAQMHSAYLYCS